MKIQSLKLVCFSPTGTTKAVVQGVARGINQGSEDIIDLTMPDARKQPLQLAENDLLVVAVPVYMGRVPALLSDWLHALEARNTPAVCIVVYGNRAYEDALLELTDVLTERGCNPIAGAAYIGEHSFSTSELPTAVGRPDANDLNHAEQFGKKISEKLLSASSTDELSDVAIPGDHPYGGMTEIWNVDFIAISDECTQCGICAESCPVCAIDPEDSNVIDIEKCITCCACIKNCPQNARSMKPSEVTDVAGRLVKLFSERKEPVFFL